MKIDVKVKNLGKLAEGTIKVRPMTVLTGPNGTGKSFFTKSLYSILNVINKNIYHQILSKEIREISFLLQGYISSVSHKGKNDELQIIYLDHQLNDLQSELDFATKLQIGEYLNFAKSRANSIDGLQENFLAYYSSLSNNTPTKAGSVASQSASLKKAFTALKNKLLNSVETYEQALLENLKDEMADNFQVTDLSELISFNTDQAIIEIIGFLDVEFYKNGRVSFSLEEELVNEVSSLARVVFFESPAYWKVSDALKASQKHLNQAIYLHQKSNKLLSGVPKYFYDLDTALKAGIKDDASSEIIELAASLKEELGGEFVFSGDNLVYKDSQTGQEISKNLISFGMTNLGMIHALLKNNVITAGSFIFIDEPETNLHPDWQVLLMNVLIRLAELNVNVVIATHSIDMLKALEVGIQQRKDSLSDDFMAIHFLDTDGQLLKFDSEQPFEQLKEARSALNSSYTSLYFDGCAID